VRACPTCHQTYSDDMVFCMRDGSRLDAAAPPPADPPQVALPQRGTATLPRGQILAGRYKILRFIGKGGMGEVYEAEDEELRERVALKTILPEIGKKEESIRRFKQEIQLARKVTHPNVSRIFDLVHYDNTIFLTMELLDGETLAARLRRTGPMPTSEALPLVTQMAAALAAAHSVGIVHRDFKCDNVILIPAKGKENGVRAVVTDFGLARRSMQDNSATTVLATATGQILGTPAYMAPEQVEGHEITPAADIYALGIVMYEMMTGRLPFEGDTPVSTAVKRLVEPPPSPRSIIHTLDARWESAILRCLGRNPEDRFQSAEEVVEALQGHAAPIAPSEAPRMLEAAAPNHAPVGRSMQLLAMIRRLDSAGLKAHIDLDETPALTPEDVRARPFNLEFPLDRRGVPQPAEIALRLDSPDFEPKSQSKKLLVPVDRDSDVCTFLLVPRVAGELVLNLEILMGDVLVASRGIRTVAGVSEVGSGRNVLVSIPLEVVAHGRQATAGAVPGHVPRHEEPATRFAPPSPRPVAAPPPPPSSPRPVAPPPRPAVPTPPPPMPVRPSPPRVFAAAPPPAMAEDSPRTVMAPLPAPPPMAQPLLASATEKVASPMPPPQGAKSGNRGLYKAVGFTSLALLIVCLVPVSYYNLRTRSSAPLPEPVATVQTNPLAQPETLPSAPSEPDTITMAPPHLARPTAPGQGSPLSVSGTGQSHAVGAKISLGDFHLQRGEYDDAIAAYRKGLELDPANAQLIRKLKAAIQTCKQEKALLGGDMKCGSP
jgi:serine/threonine protein kinase